MATLIALAPSLEAALWQEEQEPAAETPSSEVSVESPSVRVRSAMALLGQMSISEPLPAVLIDSSSEGRDSRGSRRSSNGGADDLEQRMPELMDLMDRDQQSQRRFSRSFSMDVASLID